MLADYVREGLRYNMEEQYIATTLQAVSTGQHSEIYNELPLERSFLSLIHI